MDERQKDLSNYRITQADDSLKVADYCLKETNESIYITQNDEGDMVIKSIDTYEKREQLLRLRARVLQAEWERIDGAKTMSATEARKNLRERLGYSLFFSQFTKFLYNRKSIIPFWNILFFYIIKKPYFICYIYAVFIFGRF